MLAIRRVFGAFGFGGGAQRRSTRGSIRRARQTLASLLSPDPTQPSCPTAYVTSFADFAPASAPVYVSDGSGGCSGVAEDGVLRCLPTTPHPGIEYTLAFADAQCKTPVVIDTYAGCQLPPVVAGWVYTSGTSSTRLVRVGSPIDPAPVTIYRSSTSGQCVAGITSSGSRYFAGTVISPDTFAAITDVTE